MKGKKIDEPIHAHSMGCRSMIWRSYPKNSVKYYSTSASDISIKGLINVLEAEYFNVSIHTKNADMHNLHAYSGWIPELPRASTRGRH